MKRVQESVVHFLTALQFLTVIPPITRLAFSLERFGRAVGYYPLVGALLGGLLAGLDEGLARVFPPGVLPALVLAAWVLLTGALHLDGFLDSCDGLLGGRSPEKRLDIMRDERVGAFGLAGGVCLLLLKYAALTALPVPGGLAAGRAAVLALTLGRWGMSLAVVAFPYARPEGLGKAVKDHAGWRQLGLATILTLAIVTLIQSWAGLAAWALAGLTTWAMARFVLARLPGLTGDLYGAICEIVEVVTLLFFTLDLSWV